MTFCFCQQKSVELFTDISNLFAKCRWKLPATFLYQFVNIADIMLFPAKRRWNLPLIIYICLQNVDGNFHRHLFIYPGYRWYFSFVSKTSVENFNDILHVLLKWRWKFHLQGFRSNIWVIKLKGFLTMPWDKPANRLTCFDGEPQPRAVPKQVSLLAGYHGRECQNLDLVSRFYWHMPQCGKIEHN